MAYTIDLEQLSLEDYKEIIKRREHIPSQLILKDAIEERFAYFKDQGIGHAQELLNYLKKKENIIDAAGDPIFTQDYLTVLLRHLKGMLAKPRKLVDFSWINPEIITKFKNLGIKNTKQLYDKILLADTRKDQLQKAGITDEEIYELERETDLTRIQWVNHTFARVLYEAGYETIEKIQNADYKQLHLDVLAANREKDLFKGNIGLKDMHVLVGLAQDIQEEL